MLPGMGAVTLTLPPAAGAAALGAAAGAALGAAAGAATGAAAGAAATAPPATSSTFTTYVWPFTVILYVFIFSKSSEII
jgi:hypothetical protein